MAGKERTEASASGNLGQILKEYGISALPPMAAVVSFVDHTEQSLSLEEALSLPSQDLIRQPLKFIYQAQKNLFSRKHGGSLKPQREATEIRARLVKEEGVWRNQGPARIISAIALNPGKVVRWSRKGLEGIERDWISPSEEEIMWWGWLYRKANQEKGFLMKIGKEKIDLLHAVFIARVRRQKGEMPEKDFHSFLAEISGLVPESDSFLVGSLQEVSKGYPISQS